MEQTGYGALTLALVLGGSAGTWWAWRRRGAVSGLRWGAATLLVVAAYLTRTLQLIGRIADAVGDWAARLVFSPSVWVGLGVALLAVLVWLAAGFLERRGRGAAPTAAVPPTPATAPRGAVAGGGAGTDEFADIEALLRRRGIT
ncbi:hypothetical protein [Nocardioides sp.]|uniref:hypothetical protein n=1 Tax=Nocardioides sp. TaxID=35761 RepID=UPI003513CFA8